MTAGADAAEARSRAWSVLAEVVAGRGGDVMDEARKSPALDHSLNAYDSTDDALAELERTLRFDALPWEGVYLDPSMQLGGEAAASLHDLYARCGSSVHADQNEPEHLANLALALAHLSGAEADAAEDGRDDLVPALRDLQREALDGHLLRWLPTWAAAARRSVQAFPSAVAEQVLDLALHHRGELGEPWPETFELDPPALDLDDEATGLRDIGEALARPAFSGAFLTSGDLRGIGREGDTPGGFGGRADTLETLLRESARRDALPTVLGSLAACLREHETVRSLCQGGRPWMSLLLAPHGDRVHATLALLEEMGTRFLERETDTP